MIIVRSWFLCIFKNVKVKPVFSLYFLSSPQTNSSLLSFNLLWIFWLCSLQNFFWRALVKNCMDFEWKWEVIQSIYLLILRASVLLLHTHQENMQSYNNQLQHGCNESVISSCKAQYTKTDEGGRRWKWMFFYLHDPSSVNSLSSQHNNPIMTVSVKQDDCHHCNVFHFTAVVFLHIIFVKEN